MERLIARELMDDENFGTPAQWQGLVDGLACLNRFLGGWSALRAEVDRMPEFPRRILDVAAGAADLSRRLLDYLHHRQVPAHCVALDRSVRILTAARSGSRGRADLSFLEGQARCLPFADRSFDLAMMNLALHHFDRDEATEVLKELARVGKYVIVNDLRRSVVAWAFARITFPIFTRNPLLRNDGPISVMRAYTPAEMHELAWQAGWSAISVSKRSFYRVTLAGFA